MLKEYIFIITLISYSFCEDIFYSINSKNVIHKVSDKFLSISIDPAVILAGVNLSDTSLLLARHLSPAFIRLAGPSTSFVKYLDNEEELIPHKSEAQTNVIITPSVWFGINEWFNLANLTPVFGINDDETDKGVWDPKSTIPLLEMSDKFGVTCYWQLGYDCSNKTTLRYVEDLNILRQTLDGFPEHNGTWKVVGSDLSRCIYDELINPNFENYIGDLDENVDAIMWESFFVPKEVLGFTKSSLWTSVPKDSRPVTFSSAMEWAKRIGDAAQMRYDVIFRQPRLLEITQDTPVYWFSFMYKKLMGANVLDIKPTNPSPDVMTFAHCTKRQNSFVRAGAVTILIINNGSETSTANVRLGNILFEKSMEVQSYLLSAIDDSSTEVHLNGKKLHMNMLKRADDILTPKLRRAKIKGHVTLETPPKSIGFFVLTGAKNVLCINNEEDLNSILTEINEDQDQSSKELQFKIEGRRQDFKADKMNAVRNKINLESIKNNILNEMEQDKSYYNKVLQKHNNIKSIPGYHSDKGDMVQKKEELHKHLKEFIEKAKLHDAPNNPASKHQRGKTNNHAFLPSNLQFTIHEIEDILKRRAKSKAEAKNIRLTSAELDILVNKATIKLPKHVGKRDINRLLLEEKANFHKNNMFSQEAYERYAKEKNLFPKLKYRRSELSFSRLRRDINIPLLKSEASLEEHKKYILDRDSHLLGDKHNHHNSSTRSRRDINLDLLKKKTGTNSQNRVVVQPSSTDYKTYFDEKNERRRTRPVTFSSELFKDEFDIEEQSREVSKKSRNWLEEMDNADMGNSDFESFKTPKRKYKTERYTIVPKKDPAAKRNPSFKIKNQSAGYDSKEYLQVLRAWKEFEKSYYSFPSCNHHEGFSFEDTKPARNKKFSGLWRLRSRQPSQINKGESSAIDLDEMNFSDEFEYEFYKKKRETDKEEVELAQHGRKSDNYGIMNSESSISRVKIDNVEENKLSETKNVVNANEKHFEIKKVGDNVADKIRKVKRSLMTNNLNSIFGQYQPISTGLRPWKPIDILGLQNNYFRTLPVYNWIQEQNLKNTLLQNKYLLGLRRKRYIENNYINSMENEISSNEYDTDYKVKIPKQKSVGENHNLENPNKGRDELQQQRTTTHDLFKPKLISDNIASTDKSIEETILNKNDDPESQNKRTDTETDVPKTSIQETTRTESVVDSMVSSDKLTYLERVLGRKNAKPLENFYEKVKQSFNSMNNSISTFFKKLF